MKTDIMSATRRWVSRNHFWLKSGEDHGNREATHFLLNGGNWCIPNNRHDEFLQCLADDVANGKPNWVVECHSKLRSRLVVDLDASFTIENITDAEIERMTAWNDDYSVGGEWGRICVSIQKTIYRVFPTADAAKRMVVCATSLKVKKKKKDGGYLVKAGRHLIFPDIVVSGHLGLHFREEALRDIVADEVLMQCPIMHEYAVNLDDLLDECIYTRNGFRMLYNHKAELCSDCLMRSKQRRRDEFTKWEEDCDKFNALDKLEKQLAIDSNNAPPPRFNAPRRYRFNDCNECMGTGYVDCGRPYRPVAVFVGKHCAIDDEYLNRLIYDHFFMFKETCVRIIDETVTNTPAHNMYLPLDDAEILRQFNAKRRGGGKSKKRVTLTNFVVDDGVKKRKNVSWKAVFDDDILLPVEKWLLSMFRVNEPFRQHGIDRLVKSNDGEVYIVNSVSHYCLNRAAAEPNTPEHGSSQVYFQITRFGVRQRCHSPKEYNGIRCQKYRSPVRPLPVKIKQLLFDDAGGGGGGGAMVDDDDDETSLEVSQSEKNKIINDYYRREIEIRKPIGKVQQARAKKRARESASFKSMEMSFDKVLELRRNHLEERKNPNPNSLPVNDDDEEESPPRSRRSYQKREKARTTSRRKKELAKMVGLLMGIVDDDGGALE